MKNGDQVSVLVVDDSHFVRRAVERMLAPVEGVHIVGFARNGREAVQMARDLSPDVVVLDIVMPEVDGLDAIRRIMAEAPTAIVVLSSEAQPDAEVTLTALELGAVDFISKTPSGARMDIYDVAPALREKVLAAARSRVPGRRHPDDAPAAAGPESAITIPGDDVSSSPYDVVALGASTGGPRALTRILSELPRDFPAGILIAQHMPPGFTRTLAERLDRRSPLEVREAVDGDEVRPGLALVGVGGAQLRVLRRGDRLVAVVADGVDRRLHRPCVDLLLESVVEAVGGRGIGVVLTGMGDDGARGLEALRQAGGYTIAESEETAVIYGMPGAASPAAVDVLPLGRIAQALVRRVTGKGVR